MAPDPGSISAASQSQGKDGEDIQSQAEALQEEPSGGDATAVTQPAPTSVRAAAGVVPSSCMGTGLRPTGSEDLPLSPVFSSAPSAVEEVAQTLDQQPDQRQEESDRTDDTIDGMPATEKLANQVMRNSMLVPSSRFGIKATCTFFRVLNQESPQ